MAAAAVRTIRYRQDRSAYRQGPGAASYDGSAVRVLEGEEVILRPKREVRSRDRAETRPRAKVREAGKVSVFAVVGFLAIGVFAALVLMCSLQLAVLSDQVVALDGKLATLQGEEAKLRAKYELAFDISAIEQQMTASGIMVKPQSTQIIYLDLSEPDSVVLFDGGTPEAGSLEELLAGIGQVFDRIIEYFR